MCAQAAAISARRNGSQLGAARSANDQRPFHGLRELHVSGLQRALNVGSWRENALMVDNDHKQKSETRGRTRTSSAAKASLFSSALNEYLDG